MKSKYTDIEFHLQVFLICEQTNKVSSVISSTNVILIMSDQGWSRWWYFSISSHLWSCMVEATQYASVYTNLHLIHLICENPQGYRDGFRTDMYRNCKKFLASLLKSLPAMPPLVIILYSTEIINVSKTALIFFFFQLLKNTMQCRIRFHFLSGSIKMFLFICNMSYHNYTIT